MQQNDAGVMIVDEVTKSLWKVLGGTRRILRADVRVISSSPGWVTQKGRSRNSGSDTCKKSRKINMDPRVGAAVAPAVGCPMYVFLDAFPTQRSF